MDTLGGLEALSALLLATSLAAERLIAACKTIFPVLAVEETTTGLEANLKKDKGRRIILGLLALGASYLTVALVFGDFDPLDKVSVGGVSYHLGILALLGSGGSTFWSSIVGYAGAVKDIKIAQKATARLELKARAAAANQSVTGIGETE